MDEKKSRPKPRRNKNIHVFVTENEHDRIKRNAFKVGMNITQWTRLAAINFDMSYLKED